MPNYSVPTLIDHGATLLREFQETDTKRTDILRNLATIVVGIRAKTPDPKTGQPDWAGRTAPYKDAISQMYEAAGVPPDSQSGVQAALRYHVGNVLRDKVEPKALSKAGLQPESPKDRQQARQSQAEGAPANGTPRLPNGPDTPEAMLRNAIQAVQRASTLPTPKPGSDEATRCIVLTLTLESAVQGIRDSLTAQATSPKKGTVRNPKPLAVAAAA